MQLQYIPSSSEEIITTTLAGQKSLRGVFFMIKDREQFLLELAPKISISVDGYELCRDLMITPFCANTFFFHDTPTRSINEYREVAIKSCMNVSQSVVRISALRENMIDVVLLLSDEEVEEDIVEWVESVKIETEKPSNITLRHKPDAIFAYDKIGNSFMCSSGDGNDLFMTINGSKDVCPLSVQEISPTTRCTWRKQKFTIQHPSIDKNIQLELSRYSTDSSIYLYFVKSIKK